MGVIPDAPEGNPEKGGVCCCPLIGCLSPREALCLGSGPEGRWTRVPGQALRGAEWDLRVWGMGRQ